MPSPVRLPYLILYVPKFKASLPTRIYVFALGQLHLRLSRARLPFGPVEGAVSGGPSGVETEASIAFVERSRILPRIRPCTDVVLLVLLLVLLACTAGLCCWR